MDPVIPIVLFFVGFYILIKGARILVRGAISMSRIFGLSKWFIGVAIVGIGTSIPEFAINLASTFNGQSIGLSTIIGSNTFNILFILGLSAIFMPIVMEKNWIKDIWLNLFAIVVAASFILFPIFGDSTFGGISRPEAIVLLGLFLVWITLLLRRPEETDTSEEEIFTVLLSSAMIIGGIIGVFLGGRWVIHGTEFIASILGVSEALIGLTLVAIGTSLPELTVSVVAATEKNSAISVGNIIGSNIFDFLGILGLTALIKPIAVLDNLKFDILATLGAGIILLSALYLNKKREITRKEGMFFVLIYIVYFIVIFLRG
jgi:cation:H+ antiporter